jgi:DNA uptake protein ComE-like DNA-binding protein
MTRLRPISKPNSGAALIIALGLLAVFSVLGTAWVKYMLIETEQTDFDIASVRAHEAAAGGVQAAIGSAEAALASNTLASLLETPLDFEFPVYTGVARGQNGLEANSDYMVRTHVTVTDESAKININHAPPNALRAVLHVDGERARQIRSNLPRLDGSPGDSGRRWLTSVDELMTRGLVTAKEFAAADQNAITVYTVADPASPAPYVNINGASKAVIEAVLDVAPEVADRVLAARPFTSVEALSAAAGKTPDMFNMRSDPATPDGLPRELSFTPRSLRIVSEAEVIRPLRMGLKPERVGSARAEAVIVFETGGGARVTYWSEARPQ